MDRATNSASTLAKGSSRSTQSRNDARAAAPVAASGACPDAGRVSPLLTLAAAVPATGLVFAAPSDEALAIPRGKITDRPKRNQKKSTQALIGGCGSKRTTGAPPRPLLRFPGCILRNRY